MKAQQRAKLQRLPAIDISPLYPKATDDSTAENRVAESLSKALRLQFKAQQRAEIRAALTFPLEQKMTAQQRIEQPRLQIKAQQSIEQIFPGP